MKCEFCDGETVSKNVRKQHWHQGKLYIVENVKAEVCRDCGERYYHAGTLEELDRMIESEHGGKEILSVEVLSA